MKTIAEAAAALGISDRRLRQLCEAGRVARAKRFGHIWMVPDKVVIKPGTRGPKLTAT